MKVFVNHTQAYADQDDRLREAYRFYGKSLPGEVEGSFAFALQENEEIFCARDPLGIIPLYYVQTDDGYRFASDIEALLLLPSVKKKPNLRAMRTIMQCFAVDYHETMYEGIFRLPPGCMMSIRNGKKQIERYWFPEKIKTNYHIGETEAAHKLKKLLAKAVEASVSSLEETAFELSGGVDSSSVVALTAQKYNTKEISSYSMDFGDLKCDESSFVDTFLKHYSTNHQKISVETLDYHTTYPLEYLYTLSPYWPITLTFAMSLPMLEKMKKDGKKVVVTGQGGDHLFRGSQYALYDLFVRGKLFESYREVTSYTHPWSAFKVYVLRPLLGKKSIKWIKKIIRKEEKKSFWDRCDIEDLTESLKLRNPAVKEDLDVLTSACQATVMDGNIFHCAERHFGIEYRHPFFDRELVEFALSLPPEMKYGNRTIKRILRKAMEGILPEKIRLRKDKAEFSEVISQQIAAIDLDALLKDPHIVRLGLIEQHDINQCLKEYRNGSGVYVNRLWAMINVEYWYRYNQFES